MDINCGTDEEEEEKEQLLLPPVQTQNRISSSTVPLSASQLSRTITSLMQEMTVLRSPRSLSILLEPILRRAVKEEVELAFQRILPSIASSPPLHLPQTPLPSSSLRLAFANRTLSLPIYSGTKILDSRHNALKIQLLLASKTEDRNIVVPATLPFPIKIEIVALDGRFLSDDGHDAWSVEEFDGHIVKEREGRRAILAGELHYTMRDRMEIIVGNLEFTDNSSWIKCRKFRLGARVVPGSCRGVRILEAVTEAFVVKDQRGEFYKKNYPPRLGDDVWRLEMIRKDGIFHKKLEKAGIRTVQDFLKLSVVNAAELRRILGPSMTEQKWKGIINHAKTCDPGSKLYFYREHDSVLILSPTCEALEAIINGQTCTMQSLTLAEKAHIEKLVATAYNNWSMLEEFDWNLAIMTHVAEGGMITDEYLNQGEY